MASFAADAEIQLTVTDVYVGPQTQILCDAHWLPFSDGVFDGVVIQAVLEHVLDPPRVVAEIHRVLRDGGYVYSQIPFMQQVHAGAHDFTRYTALGHRRLFRNFEGVWLGAIGGPGMALAWSVRYWLASFTGRRAGLRSATMVLTPLLTSWLTWLDGRLAKTPGGLDAASGTGFLGRRSEVTLADEELIRLYAGAMPALSWED